MKRSISPAESFIRESISITAGPKCSATKSGIVRWKMTPNPSGSTLQPMISSVSGHSFSPVASIWVAPPSPARRIMAAAPSPNRLAATILALVNSSWRTASVQSSSATRSTLVPGRACARRDAIDSPDTPPAHPRPKTGTRDTSLRKPSLPATRASSVGVAMPVEHTVTTVSISLAERSARARLCARRRRTGIPRLRGKPVSAPASRAARDTIRWA